MLAPTNPAAAPDRAPRGPIRRLLVRLPNWLGDALLARPVLHALRRAHPAAEVRAVGPAPLVGLLAWDGSADGWDGWPGERDARGKLVARLAAWGPDAALVLPPSFSSAWLAWRSGARIRIGFAHEGRSVLLTRSLRRPARGESHLSDEYLALGRVLGASAVAVPRLVPDARAREAARGLLAARGVPEARLAILGPGAIYGSAKRWHPERFAALARALAEEGWSALVCGTAGERATAEEVARHSGSPATVLAGETELTTQAALCALASVTVCNDSGLAHLAAAVGAPTVAIFGSTSSAWSAPLGPRVRVVQRAPVCSPCFQRTCRIGAPCLEAITVADVLRACREVAA